jgi:hypothetical protein
LEIVKKGFNLLYYLIFKKRKDRGQGIKIWTRVEKIPCPVSNSKKRV